MIRETIDYGIDLGTTNSAIAVMNGKSPQVFRNNEGFEYTPSAVSVDSRGSLRVGRRAKERLDDDSENAFAEFKLQMGEIGAHFTFQRDGRVMTPEDLSAEVLKSLKSTVFQANGEDVKAAVITVPAAFELPACQATNKAAKLAGLQVSPLINEPVAAALAYGFEASQNNAFWLVFDFGGGTFDAAVMQLRDGEIQVVNHGGDNQLGGKLIDWAIVDEILMPQVLQENRKALTDFKRGNNKWRSAISKLKLAAEQAKIQVSADDSAEIIIDFLCQDDSGAPVKFEYLLRRKDVERITESFLVRAINICRKVLKEKRLEPRNIEKVLLVGGPTLMPYVRARLQDPKHGLGIPLEFSIDPLTVVAQGAAIFAKTQRLGKIDPGPLAAGVYNLDLEYKPVGSDIEPLVGGKVIVEEGVNVNGFVIEFNNPNAQPPWRSGQMSLSPEGTFMVTLLAERDRENLFYISLYDDKGSKLETIPDKLTYAVGMVIKDPPLIHSIGVALSNNQVSRYMEKGELLPHKKRKIHRTTVDVRRGEDINLIRIPVVEGENLMRADRNRLIGYLEITSDKIRRDVPAGSEVEVTIEMDASRLIRTKAYVEVLEEEFEGVLDLGKEAADPVSLRADLHSEKKRLHDFREKAAKVGDATIQDVLTRIEEERMVEDVDTALTAAPTDRDAANKCRDRLLDLKVTLDTIEDLLEWPALVASAEDLLHDTRDLIYQDGQPDDRNRFESLEVETRRAMDARFPDPDPDLLRNRISEVEDLYVAVLREQDWFWVSRFQYHQSHSRKDMRDQAQADLLFARGVTAIQNNDIGSLKVIVRQLVGLLPAEKAGVRGEYGGTLSEERI